MQIVNQCTWSRVISGVFKESLLDHIYVKNYECVQNLTYFEPTFGDHKLIIVGYH